MIEIILHDLITGREEVHSSYDEIGVYTAICLMDFAASEEAKGGHLTIQYVHYLADEKHNWERILVDDDGNQVAKFYLKFTS